MKCIFLIVSINMILLLKLPTFCIKIKQKNNKNVPKKINFIAIIIMDIVFKHNISMIKLHL